MSVTKWKKARKKINLILTTLLRPQLPTTSPPDRPMTRGGLPGHTVAHEDHTANGEGIMGKLGEYGAWAVFALTILSLPVILWWIF